MSRGLGFHLQQREIGCGNGGKREMTFQLLASKTWCIWLLCTEISKVSSFGDRRGGEEARVMKEVLSSVWGSWI
jgi:hypothetical protein